MKARKLRNSELNRLTVDAFKGADKTPVVVVLDNVRSLHNIGSVFRTADAFLITKVYLCGITATPPHKDIHKTALGATESVDWEYESNIGVLLPRLKENGYVTVALEQAENALQLHEFRLVKGVKYALVFGNEVKGVSQEIVSSCEVVLEIPQQGTKHSLNISVSAGIVLWDFWYKWNALRKP